MFNQTNGPYGASPSSRPPETASFVTVIQGMSNKELQQLLEDDARIDEVVQESTEIKSVESLTEKLTLAAASSCEVNLALRPTLEARQQNLVALHAEVKAARQRFVANKSRLDDIAATRSPDTILALMQSAMMEAEDAAEKTANNLLSGSISCDAFLENFIRERGLAHKRRIKAEKLSEMIRTGALSERPAPAPSDPTSSLRPSSSSSSSRPRRPGPGYCSPHLR